MPAAAFVDPRKPLLAVPPPVLLADPLLVSKHAGLAVVGDLGAAGAASLCVAPCVSIIDKAIIQSAAGAARLEVSLLDGLASFARSPLTFLRRPEVLMMWGVYSCTYAVANVISTIAEIKKVNPEMPKLLGTTVANMGAGIAKDRAYARMFGTVAPRGLPALSYMFFFARDLTTIGASFNVPDPLSRHLQEMGVSKTTADVSSQLLCPVAMQLVTTPMFLMGLDLYNRPTQTLRDRMELIAANYRKTVAARMGRILPAFGFGGLGNKAFRGRYRDMLQDYDARIKSKTPGGRLPNPAL